MDLLEENDLKLTGVLEKVHEERLVLQQVWEMMGIMTV